MDRFYNEISECLEEVKGTDVRIVMGDFNAKVGSECTDEITGHYGLGERNDRGERLVQFCQEENMTISNTLFQHQNRHLYTWTSPGDRIRNQIDYILVKTRFRNHVKNVKTYPEADIMSDHCLLVAKLKIKLKIPRKSKKEEKYELDLLKQDHYKERFSIEVKNRFDSLMIEENEQVEDDRNRTNKKWQCLKKSIHGAEASVLPKKEGRKDKSWMTQEILDMMEERRVRKNNPDYKLIDKETKRKCKERKEEWYNDLCKEIEELEREHKIRELHEKVKKMTDRKRNIKTNSGCIKDKNGKLLVDKKDVKARWEEYVRELNDDPNRKEKVQING